MQCGGQHLNEQNSRERSTPSRGQQSYILLVEDDEEIGHFLVVAIEQETAYTPLWVVTGHDALRVVQDHRPVLFLMNYHLPSMTGLQLYDQLHALAGLEAIPAIMMSATLPRAELQHRGILGLDKPFDLDELLHLIERAIQKHE